LPESLKRLDENGIKSLQVTLKSYKKAVEERLFNQRLIEHKNFHMNLASLSGGRIQVQVLKHLFDLLYLKFGGSILFASFIDKTTTEHHEIFEAIVSKDLDLVQKRLSDHILNTKRRLIADLGKMISEKETARF
jgi:DNA-binding GntR family transcriptional regulator